MSLSKIEHTVISDCGVYMGEFSIQANIICDMLQIEKYINAYEASPLLIEPIKKNLKIYDVEAKCYNYGIGETFEEKSLFIKKGRMIGSGSRIPPQSFEPFEIKSKFIPMENTIDPQYINVVKLDLEGNEVEAFRSICNNINKMNNIFIVEFSTYQQERSVCHKKYIEWIFDNYNVYGLGGCLSAIPGYG